MVVTESLALIGATEAPGSVGRIVLENREFPYSHSLSNSLYCSALGFN
jgi:hypothetical protein